MASLRSRRTTHSSFPSETRSRPSSFRHGKRKRDYSLFSRSTVGNKLWITIAVALLVLLLCLGIIYLKYIVGHGRSTAGTQPSRLDSNSSPPLLATTLSEDQDLALEWHHDTSDNTSKEQPHASSSRYQIIFSTDCSPYQHWQSYLFFYSAYKVRQPGHVTRIVSGCTPDQAQDMQAWFDEHVQPLSKYRFHLHLTPHFSNVKDKETGEVVGDYKFFNKPFGLLHWMEHAQHFVLSDQQDDVVVLMDPDMVLLRPMTRDFSNERETVISPKRRMKLLSTRVEHGVPFAQTYGLGTQWETFDLDKIAGPNSPAKLVNMEDGRLFYPAGPPYIATAKDMHQIALHWTEFAPRVHAQYPHLLAEMFAYCIAAAHLGLKHQLVDSLMVSNTGMSNGEGWALVDKIPAAQMCEFASHPRHDVYALPSVVHLCQRYCVGEDWFFGKHRVPNNVYDCDYPLFVEPPSNLALLHDFKKPPNQKDRKALSKTLVARETFMVCFLTSLLNEAASFYKQRACPAGTANLAKSLKMTDLFSARERK